MISIGNLLYELSFGLFIKLCELTEALTTFLFTEIRIPGFITLSMWELIGGVGITLLLGAWLIKKIVPVA